MNLFKIAMKIIVVTSSIAAAGSRPGRVETYLMLTRSDYFQKQLLQKLMISNRSTIEQWIKNRILRAALKKTMKPNASAMPAKHENKSNTRMNQFKLFHQ